MKEAKESMFLKENIQNAQNGDQHALIGLVEKFRPLMLNLAKKINDEDAFPNIQAVFIELIQHLKLQRCVKPMIQRYFST